jgi:hypothetical protein
VTLTSIRNRLSNDYYTFVAADIVTEYAVMPTHAAAPAPRDLDCGHRSGRYATDFRDGKTRCLECYSLG